MHSATHASAHADGVFPTSDPLSRGRQEAHVLHARPASLFARCRMKGLTRLPLRFPSRPFWYRPVLSGAAVLLAPCSDADRPPASPRPPLAASTAPQPGH